MSKEDRERARRDRRLVFWLQIHYLLALAAVAVLYFTETIKVRPFVGTVPTAVPWFDALGAALISLTGVLTWCETGTSAIAIGTGRPRLKKGFAGCPPIRTRPSELAARDS
ncbi:MAG TPA: hypothetical protein DEV93_14665 [Chloroflexi bacterium]|jgi:hypothetical protein|nr:hypothetical protein [Chloroflexota bacterium]